MAEVTKLNTGETSYPEPDFGVIGQTTKDISRLPFFNTEMMKALQKKAERVSSYALDLREIVGSELVTLSTKLGNLGLTDAFSTLTEIDTELAKGTLDAETTKAAGEARAETVGVISTTLGETIGKFRDAAAQLSSKVDEMGNVVIVERTEETLADQKARQVELAKSIAEKEAEEKQLKEDRGTIIASQDVIREKNIADMFADYIPSDDDLKGMDLKNKEVEAIKQGAKLAKKVLKNVSEGLKYAELADARKAIESKIDAAETRKKEFEADLQEADDLVADLGRVMTIDEKRTILMGEVNKLSTAWTSFADQLNHLEGSDVTEARITGLTRTMEAYLKKITEERNKVILV